MITRIRVKNFRSLADVDVKLGPLTVLVGRNGAGKSALIDVLRLTRDALRNGMDWALEKRNGFASLQRVSDNHNPKDIHINLTGERRSYIGHYAYTLGSTDTNGYVVKEETCRFGEDSFERYEQHIATSLHLASKHDTILKEFNPKLLILPMMRVFLSSELINFYDLLNSVHAYALNPSLLRHEYRISNGPTLSEQGENLPYALQQVLNSEWKQTVLNALNLVVHDIDDVRVQQLGNLLATQIHHTIKDTATWFEAYQESDGTLLLLGLLTALYQNVTDSVLILEEPETALHPHALPVLADVIKEASLRNQIMITTQSPDLISCFAANQLRIVERTNGITQIGPLSDYQQEAINKELFSGGDLLRIEDLHGADGLVKSAGDA